MSFWHLLGAVINIPRGTSDSGVTVGWCGSVGILLVSDFVRNIDCAAVAPTFLALPCLENVACVTGCNCKQKWTSVACFSLQPTPEMDVE